MAYGLITHVAIEVPDLIKAEKFYTTFFNTDVNYRQTEIDGEWYTLPEKTDWEAAIKKGVEPEMSFIARDEFFLALAAADEEGPIDNVQSHHIGLQVDEGEFKRLFHRAEQAECSIIHRGQNQGGRYGLIEDIFGVEWDVAVSWSTAESASPSAPWLDF
jgi:uncharacterized glyoxalase superfamily protein PhnB